MIYRTPWQFIGHQVLATQIVLRATSITKGRSGPSGIDADGWRRMLTSNSFGRASSDIGKSIVDFAKTFAVRE